jgi:hypothetical protein
MVCEKYKMNDLVFVTVLLTNRLKYVDKGTKLLYVYY